MTTCGTPLTDEVQLAWWTGEATSADRRRVEEHLLGCAACAARLRFLERLSEGIASLLAGGHLSTATAPVVLERLRRDGRRIREYAVPPGGAVQCTVGPDDDLLLARLGADLRGVARLDLVTRVDDGPEQRFADLAFDPEAGELLLLPPVHLVRVRPASVERMELRAVSPEGERVLGRYAFHHTPWPGAGP